MTYVLVKKTELDWLIQNAFQPLEISLYPMAGDTLAQSKKDVLFYDVDVRPSGSDPIFEKEFLTETQAEAVVADFERQFPQAWVNDLRDLL